ncbi:MAG TPA: prepilin peptidase [Candidatus Saccharimonadia bacterium]
MLDERLIWAVAAAGFGLIFGSAINALVWRLKVGRSWVHGRSECPDCGHKLAAKDLVPVFSWLWLGGKCRYCKRPIQDHPLVEVVTALLFGLSVFVLLPVTWIQGVLLGIWLVMLVLLVALAAFDARWMLLPDKLMAPLAVVAVGYMLTAAGTSGSWRVITGSLGAAVVFGGAFLLLTVLTRGRGMGGGDIKLAFVMGLMLGLKATALAMLVAFNVAALVGIGLIVMKHRRRRDQIPFGPFLVLGTVVAFLWGRQVFEWYLSVNGLN